MAPAPLESPAQFIKKQRNLNKAVDKWVWHPFENSARKDNFKLSHWMKEKERDEVYPFSRFNRQAEVVRYTEDEYEKVIADLSTDWSREETDHLLNLCERFSLRFIVIADRFDLLDDDIQQFKKREVKALNKHQKKQQKKKEFSARTVDEIKDRYYTVSKAVLEYRGQYDHPIVKKPFNYEQEVKRKCNIEKLALRTKDQQEKEKQLILEMKKIEQKIKKEEKEEKNLRKLIYLDTNFSQPPQTVTTVVQEQEGNDAQMKDETVLQDEAGPHKGGRRDRGSGVYLRSQML